MDDSRRRARYLLKKLRQVADLQASVDAGAEISEPQQVKLAYRVKWERELQSISQSEPAVAEFVEAASQPPLPDEDAEAPVGEQGAGVTEGAEATLDGGAWTHATLHLRKVATSDYRVTCSAWVGEDKAVIGNVNGGIQVCERGRD